MNRRTLYVGVCLIALIPISALSADQKPYPAVTEVKDGVKTITNPGFPRDGRFIAKLTEEMSCGNDGGPPEALLNKPVLFDVDDQGNVYVMDSGDVSIKAYDKRGRFIRSIGRPGQGPGEFGGIMASLRPMTRGRLCVLDLFQRRVMIMASEGRYLSGFSIKGNYSGVEVDAKDRIFLSNREHMVDIDKLTTSLQEVPYLTNIYRVDSQGGQLTPLTQFSGETWAMDRSGELISSVGGAFIIVWNISHEGKLFGGFTGEFSLGVFGEDGKKEIVFGRQYTPLKDTGYRGKVGQKKTKPVFRAITMDEEDSLWLDLYHDDAAKGFLYDVFSPDGIYRKQVAIGQEIGRFRNGKVYSLVRSVEGYPSIKRYKMELVPNLEQSERK